MCYGTNYASYLFYQEDKLRREKEKIDKDKKRHKSKDRKQKKKHRKHYFESESSATDSEDEMVQPSLKTTAMKPSVSYVNLSIPFFGGPVHGYNRHIYVDKYFGV